MSPPRPPLPGLGHSPSPRPYGHIATVLLAARQALCWLEIVIVLVCRISGCSLEQEFSGVHPICLQMDEQPSHEGIPLEMCHQTLGFISGEQGP